ncbi:hypothetical protein GCM10010260_31120 [Streptomyces filipinensis]|uniref:Major facilitator superfamily (MFS) profile domain-containing protein n=1 Tax=Streptomyces filipinensis TaxID=66887 RepID=A0A918MBP1_9ACTN|nr:hypothetical protein [Streptomyces filipinensis]GGU93807.1 hypothetical protein GCM10010260_31120 [Streptomyces filipinensis]
MDWRWAFAVNVAIGIAAMLAGRAVLPKSATREAAPLPDLRGAPLLNS